MIVGTLRVRLFLRESRSLKDKRQVTRSILDRLRNAYNISISEIEARDDHRLIVLGMAIVGDSPQAIRHQLQSIQEALRKHPIAEYLDSFLEVDRIADPS